MDFRNSITPTIKEGTFRSSIGTGEGLMTAKGTYNKTAFLLFLTIAGAAFAWSFPYSSIPALGSKLTLFLIAGLVLALVTIFKKEWAPYTAPAYAVAEGLVLGSLSKLFNLQFPGIVMQAVALTFGIFAVMLALYRFRIIRMNEKLMIAIVAATLGVFVVYLVNLLMMWITGTGLSFVMGSGTGAVVFSLFVVAIASFNLLINFDFIDQMSYMGAPKYMEWYAGFSLIVTLVWLYIEVLNLLAKMRQN